MFAQSSKYTIILGDLFPVSIFRYIKEGHCKKQDYFANNEQNWLSGEKWKII